MHYFAHHTLHHSIEMALTILLVGFPLTVFAIIAIMRSRHESR